MFWRIDHQSSAGIAVMAMISLALNAILILGAICLYFLAMALRAEVRRNRGRY